ncbi:MAG: hypothetical protein JNM07_09505 [Phycisphaerae bacterium]|nr:hypothetical protein [Phycisphaerae bacterium]
MIRLIAAVIAALAIGASARAQCREGWLGGYSRNQPPGPIDCATTWDPDGDGPEKDWLVVGGWFGEVDGRPAQSVAAWNGREWVPLGTELSGNVRALTVYKGVLVAGGNFDLGDSIFVGDLAWLDTGGELGGVWRPFAPAGQGGGVDALCVFKGELIVGGYMRFSDRNVSGAVLRYDGASWRTLGSGLQYGDGTRAPYVRSFAEVGGRLIVGGRFDHAGGVAAASIAAWDGSDWSALGAGLDGEPNQIVGHSGEVFAAQMLLNEDGWSEEAQVSRFDGARWVTLRRWATPEVTIASTSDGLIAAGDLWRYDGKDDGDEAAPFMARWSGVNWQRVRPGPGYVVERLMRTSAGLLATGPFGSIESTPCAGIALLTERGWEAYPRPQADGVVNNFCEFRGELIAGGWFSAIGGVGATHLAAWDGAAWRGFAPAPKWGVYGLTVFREELIAAGNFSGYAGRSASELARWDGAAWRALGAGPTDGEADWVDAIGHYRGRLVASVSLYKPDASGARASQIRAWDGRKWSDLTPSVTNLRGTVSVLREYRGELYAAGSFMVLGTVGTRGIARWDGSAWRAVGEGLAGTSVVSVGALAEWNGKLVVGGSFRSAGGIPAHGLAFWGGERWSAPGFPLGDNAVVRALEVQNGLLVVGGYQLSPASASGQNLVRWTTTGQGGGWEALDEGPDGGVNTLRAHQGVLHVGGGFDLAGGARSASWARWGCVDGGSGLFGGRCAADFNDDGVADDRDVLEFLYAFERLEIGADLNHDGGIDDADWYECLDRMNIGC